MCALDVYTHYALRILNFWKAFQRLPLPKEFSRPMSLDLKRQLVAQLVESSRLLRNYIDHRAKGRGTTRAATDVLQDIPAAAIETSLETLHDIKERIKNFAEPPDSVAAK
jgi:hypothetical protein